MKFLNVVRWLIVGGMGFGVGLFAARGEWWLAVMCAGGLLMALGLRVAAGGPYSRRNIGRTVEKEREWLARFEAERDAAAADEVVRERMAQAHVMSRVLGTITITKRPELSNLVVSPEYAPAVPITITHFPEVPVPEGATRVRQGLTQSEVPGGGDGVCNKCGHVGPCTANGTHARPDGSLCGYLAVVMKRPGFMAELSEANAARQAEWDPSDKITLEFRGNELGGEVGEAQNVIKKLARERMGLRGSRDTAEHLAQELADVVICADLCAMTAGIDLGAAVVAKFNATSEKYGLKTRMGVSVGACASSVAPSGLDGQG